MEKWKKKIIRCMYKQWMSKQKVSAEDIIKYFNNPKNSAELYQSLLNELDNDLRLKIRGFIHYRKLKKFI